MRVIQTIVVTGAIVAGVTSLAFSLRRELLRSRSRRQAQACGLRPLLPALPIRAPAPLRC
jgi:hypothetical protein